MDMDRPTATERVECSLSKVELEALRLEARRRGLQPDEYATSIIVRTIAPRINELTSFHRLEKRGPIENAGDSAAEQNLRLPKVQVAFKSRLAVRDEIAFLASREQMSNNQWFERQVVRTLNDAEESPTYYPHPAAMLGLEDILMSGLDIENSISLGKKVVCVYRVPPELKIRIDDFLENSWASATMLYLDSVSRATSEAFIKFHEAAQRAEENRFPVGNQSAGSGAVRSADDFKWRPWGDQNLHDGKVEAALLGKSNTH